MWPCDLFGFFGFLQRCFVRRSPGHGGQLSDTTGWVRGHASEDIGDVGHRIHLVQPARDDERLDDSDAFRGAVGAGEQPVRMSPIVITEIAAS